MLRVIEDDREKETLQRELHLVLPEIAELEEVTFSRPWREPLLSDMLKYPCHHLLYLKEEELLGYAIYSDVAGDAELERIAVNPEIRQRGYGSRLMEAVLQDLEQREAERISLEVRAGNEQAVRLYRKYGFRQAAIRRRYYTLPDEDALVMQKILRRKEI